MPDVSETPLYGPFMRRLVSVISAAFIALAGSTAVAVAATSASSAHHFANCTDMHRVYKGGVARRGAHDHRTSGGYARYTPRVSTRLYNANSQMDRDKDGVACEQ